MIFQLIFEGSVRIFIGRGRDRTSRLNISKAIRMSHGWRIKENKRGQKK